MKKTLLIITLGLMTSLVSNAQSSKGKMRIMAGFGVPNFAAASLSNVDEKFGPYQIGYKYFMTDKFSIGLMYNYSSAKTTNMIGVNNNGDNYTYNYAVTFNTFLAQLDYSWYNRPSHNWYSGLSLGTVNVNAKATVTLGNGLAPEFTSASSGLAYHITAVGYHGNIGKNFGLYSELGFGYNGLLNAGLTYSFK